MPPVRLVLDTNVIVSAALKPSGFERAAFNVALTRFARLYISSHVVLEYAEVLQRPKLAISKGLRLQILQLIRNRAHKVTPARMLQVCADPEDDIVLECADAARADYLITGNRKHFPAHWKSTKIINAREFMDLATPHIL